MISDLPEVCEVDVCITVEVCITVDTIEELDTTVGVRVTPNYIRN